MSNAQRQAKLKKLVQSEGFETVEALLEAVVCDSVSPAICMQQGCSYTTSMEPDQRAGYCEICGTNSVVAALALAGYV